MNNKKMFVISILTVVILFVLSITTFATSQDLNSIFANQADDGFENITSGNQIANQNEVVNQVGTTGNQIQNQTVPTGNQTPNTITPPTSTTNNITNNTIGNNTVLPQTGLNSSLTIMIIICAVSILFTYSKIRKSDI